MKNQTPISPLTSAAPNVMPVAVACDLGNAIAKMVVVKANGYGKYVTYPHAILDIQEHDFENMRLRTQVRRKGIEDTFFYHRTYKNRDTNEKGDIDKYVIVGSNAGDQGFISRRSGSLKYEPAYYGAYAMRGLLELFPKGHPNVHLLAMFPPGDIAYVQSLKDALGGTHHIVTTDGSEVKYTIRSVRVVDEPVGGLMHRLIGVDGDFYNDTGITGRRILVIDIGGQVSSMTPATNEGDVNYNRARSFGIGILDVEKTFEDNLRTMNREFRTVRLLGQEQIREALVTGEWSGGGGKIDVSPVVDKACSQILNKVHDLYENEMGGALTYDHILVTGGGGALLFNRLRDEVLNHKSVVLVDVKTEEMHLANVRGAAKMFYATLKQDHAWKGML